MKRLAALALWLVGCVDVADFRARRDAEVGRAALPAGRHAAGAKPHDRAPAIGVRSAPERRWAPCAGGARPACAGGVSQDVHGACAIRGHTGRRARRSSARKGR